MSHLYVDLDVYAYRCHEQHEYFSKKDSVDFYSVVLNIGRNSHIQNLRCLSRYNYSYLNEMRDSKINH